MKIAILKKGVTLVEMLVAIAVVTMLMTGVTLLFTQAWKINAYVYRQSIATLSASQGAQVFAREVRQARQSDAGDYAFVSGSDTEVTLFADLDKDGLVERLHYYYDESNGHLLKGITDPTGTPPTYAAGDATTVVVAANIINDSATEPIFRYYNDEWPENVVDNPLTTPVSPQEVRIVEINLFVDPDEDHEPSRTEIKTLSAFRNLNEEVL